MTPLPTPAELRESATALDDAYNDFGQGYGFEETANHLRQFADLIEDAQKGVTDEVVAAFDREYSSVMIPGTVRGTDRRRAMMKAALTAVAPHLALMTKLEE